jgi:hypothetical protein
MYSIYLLILIFHYFYIFEVIEISRKDYLPMLLKVLVFFLYLQILLSNIYH